MELLSQQPMFSVDPSTKGFDILAGNKWIYPVNYPLREYQFAIVKTALFHNTLVGLPTGLGKTFIAAVVMYNYWRWYPMGKIVFLAPTKPLVAQQIDACHDIMGIPISETIELTGSTNQKQRQLAWTKKRVIFATPQTFQNDIEKNIVPLELIKCVVIDEAHKALGKYAYGESIRMLYEGNKYFRVLALSATPGSKMNAVQEVIKNLHITQLELRDDSSSDITPYVNEKKFDIIQVSLGDDLIGFYGRYLAIVDPYYRILLNHKIINCSLTNISKGRLFMVRQELQAKRVKNTYINGAILKNLNIVYTMVYAKELMAKHGLRAFYNFYQVHADKFWLKDVPDLEVLLQEINEYLGPFPDITPLINGSVTDVPNDVKFGHGKFLKLKEILVEHFKNATDSKIDTRAIVFVEFRDSVNEIYILLLQFQPLIRPQVFVGQAKAGLKQKDQKKALNNFRQNKVNVLISTSVGEEGLDVGEVDLIVCFDNAAHSTTRLVQRIGRTGRKRNGRVIALATEGKENHELKSVLSRKDSFNSKILRSSGIVAALNNESPRMVPEEIDPECLKMHMTVIPVTPRGKSMRKVGVSKKGKVDKMSTKKNAKNSPSIQRWIQNDNTNKKNNKQSSLMTFLQSNACPLNMTQDNEIVSMRVEGIHKPQSELLQPKNINLPKIKQSNVKLLSTDKDAIEFLTLCAMKESMKDQVIGNSIVNIPYMPMHSEDDVDPFTDFEVPPLQILKCLISLEKYVSIINDSEDDYNHGNDINDWEPIEFPDNDHYLENSRSQNFSDLPKGQFEDLLNDSSDSNETLYCPDDTLPSNERIELTVDGDNSVLHKVEADINEENKENETSDLSHSVVENGAFEDLLNTSSDDSSIKILSNDSNDGKPNSSDNKLKDKNCTSSETKRTPKKVETLDSPLDIEFSNDFGSWGDAQNNYLLSSTIRSSSPNLVSSRRSLMSFFQQINAEVENRTQKTPKQVNINSNKSPDLFRFFNSKKSEQSKVNITLSNLSEKPAACIESSNDKIQHHSSDEDLFGVDSLLADSDFEEQITVIENSDVSNEKSTDKEKKPENLKNDELPVEKVEEKKNEDNKDSSLSKPTKQNELDESFVDGCDWSSDFEVLDTPIIESKYFAKNSDSTLSNKSNVCRTTNTSNDSDHLAMSQKQNYPNWISRFKPKSQENVNKSKSKKKIFKHFSSNYLRPTHRDSDSDDDFQPLKIEKVDGRDLKKNLKNNERPSDSSKSVKNTLNLQKDNSSKSKSITNLSNRFAAPEKFASGTRNTSGINAPWVQQKRLSSSDNCKKRKKVKKRKEDKKRRKNEFINDEADVSSGDYSLGSSGDDEDDNLGDFVSYTQYHDQTVDMRAHYLQSLKSPRITGKFLIKQPSHVRPDVEIYSQVIPEENNTYLHDSFCVADEEISEKISSDEVTILEEIEKNLEEKKRKRKISLSNGSRSKRKRIVQDNDTSEDEMENMRAQIAEESMILKKL